MNISDTSTMNALLILEVLKKYSDENNKLSQKKVLDLVKREYDVLLDRRTVERLIKRLYDFNWVEYAERNKQTGETPGWYFERDITDAEIRMLIDGLLFSKYIPYSECKKLIDKLEHIAGVDFKNSYGLPENRPENKQIFLNIEELLRAMSIAKKVSFNYLRYGTDKEPSIVLDKDDNPRTYTVSPYEIVISNGHYYLICAPDHADTVYHYRLNAICNIKVLKSEKRRPIREIPGFRNGLNLAEYMKELPYMMSSGKSVRAVLRFNKSEIRHIVECFGKDVHLMDDTESTMIAIVRVNDRAMLYWALQYGMYVEVLEPQSLRESIRDAVTTIADKYK